MASSIFLKRDWLHWLYQSMLIRLICVALWENRLKSQKKFHVKWQKVKFFPYVSYYLSNFFEFIKNQQVQQFSKNKKHLIKYEEHKTKQMLTQNFYFSTSVWFSQSPTLIECLYCSKLAHGKSCCCGRLVGKVVWFLYSGDSNMIQG